MSEDWQPGDVAICVDDAIYGSHQNRSWGLREGDRLTVIKAFWDANPKFSPNGKNIEGVSLIFLEKKNPFDFYTSGAWESCRFKKEPPLVKETETEREKELNDC